MVGALFFYPIPTSFEDPTSGPMTFRFFRPMRLIGLLAGSFLLQPKAAAQQLTGAFTIEVPPNGIVLLGTVGADRIPIDTANINAGGAFRFNIAELPAGFYQLMVNDTDRVDLILDPREQVIEISFSGIPLQENITIHRSVENQRMWEYKMISRQSQEKIFALHLERSAVDTSDQEQLHRLAAMEADLVKTRRNHLHRLIQQDTTSYFATVVLADRALELAVPQGHLAIRDAIDWTDGRLLRSSLFPKAIMAWMQNAPPHLPDGLVSASDSLLVWTRPNAEAWNYTRSMLIRLFDSYGPEVVSQYLMDRYVTGPDALVPPGEDVLALLKEQMKVAIGAKAPDVMLPAPAANDTLQLLDLVAANEFTAIFFYSSNCDHCHDQIQPLNTLFADRKDRGFGVIGIALDADATEFHALIEQEKIQWPAFSELIGWGSPAAKAFNVKATPTFFLLDRNGTIVAKPYDHIELKAELMRLMDRK